MDRDRHRLVKRLFDGAIERTGDARLEYLDRECGADRDLRLEVDALLRHDELGDESGDEAAEIVRRAAAEAPQGMPSSVGRYPIEREIGRGGMGVVYLGIDPSLERKVAIKTLPRRLAEDRRRLELLEREARLVAALSHPNIAVVHSLEEADGRRFLTMEYIEGENLTDLVARGPLGIDHAVGIARGLARALEAAHHGGVIHRDVKPGNVRITRDGLVKVLDFGIAGAVDSGLSAVDAEIPPIATEHAPTRATPVPTAGRAGTPQYMSPERLRGERGDVRSDIWAFGCVAFEMLTGSPVSPAVGFEPGRLPADVPDGLRDLLASCLAGSREQRPANMTVVRRGVDKVRRALRAEAERPSGDADSDRHRIPRPLSSFVGRSNELASIATLLATNRLVTLTGLGGTGKTRLGIEVARRARETFPDGVVYVALAPLETETAAVREIASTLGVSDTSTGSVVDGVADHIGEARIFLVLDNCEHLIDACARVVVALTDRCPALTVLATSREPLHVPGETIYRVPSLRIPDDARVLTVDELADVDSIHLFVDRARAALNGFALSAANASAVADICRRLDGIPLAIELAAARAGTISVADIAKRLDQRFRLLVGSKRTVLPRQRTLRSVIDWSHEQLDDHQRAVFRRLAVFSGGWSLEAAEAVTADPSSSIFPEDVLDLVSELVDKSLVEIASGDPGRSRFRLLESVRDYARGHLRESGEEPTACDKHAEYFTLQAEEASPHLKDDDQAVWMDMLDLDRENQEAACRYLLDLPDPTRAARLMVALDEFWYVRGHWRLGAEMTKAALEHPGGLSDATLAFDVGFYNWLHASRVGIRDSDERLEPLVEQARAIGDEKRLARALNSLAIQVGRAGDGERERALLEEVIELASKTGNPRLEAIALYNLGFCYLDEEDFEAARTTHERALEIRRREGLKRGVGMSLGALGEVLQLAGDTASAERLFRESAEILREVGDLVEQIQTLVGLAHCRLVTGSSPGAAETLREALAICEETGITDVTEQAIDCCAFVIGDADPVTAATLLGAADARRARGALERKSPREEAGVIALREKLRSAATPVEADRAYERGLALSLEEGLALAVSTMTSPPKT